MTEVQQDGVILEDFLVILTRQQRDAAHHPAASAVSPQLGDAFDRALYGTEQGLLRMVRRARAADDVDDPFIVQREKIMNDVKVSYERLSLALISECSTWMSRRIEELERQQQAKGDTIVEKEVGHGAH